MKLYYDPISTTSRPVMLILAEIGLHTDREVVSLIAGETRTSAFRAINPAAQVPVLVDGDFVLTECAAILKYLAEEHAPQLYSIAARERARIDEAISMLSTDLHLWLDVFTVYPATLLANTISQPTVRELATLAKPRLEITLNVLEERLAQHLFLARGTLSIADFLGASYVTLAELIDFDFSSWPALRDWIARMKRLDGWQESFAGFEGLRAALATRTCAAA